MKVSLREVSESIKYGLTASATIEDTGYKFLRITDIANGSVDFNTVPNVELDRRDLPRYQLEFGDIVIARTGASTGAASYFMGPENVVFASYLVRFRIKPTANSRFVSYVLRSETWKDFIYANAFAKSAQPNLSANSMSGFEFDLPDFETQRAIADVLGALDDKIAANQRIADSITDLQSAIWNRAIQDVERVPVGSVALPQLGGTPARKVQENWTNEIPWSSVADMTAANGKYLLNTAEGISIECAKTRRFAPLPAGAVLLSARGTVGKVVTLVSPTSFNQSAYGFTEPENRSAALRLAIEGIVEELRSKSYGSVFSTITKGTILECTVPNVFHEEYSDLHSHLGMLEDRAISAVQENQVLAATRDELLPLLMNGKITVDEAEEAVGDVGVVKQKQ
ncbi:restriction endonuclease subunit S [Corynebacterium propinquum]